MLLFILELYSTIPPLIGFIPSAYCSHHFYSGVENSSPIDVPGAIILYSGGVNSTNERVEVSPYFV
jgi:hypothetical protein